MRWHVIAVIAVAAVIAGAVVFVACSGESCTPNVLTLHLGLLDDSTTADTITVTGNDPGASVMASFPHTPDPTSVSIGVEHTQVAVTFPGAFPAHALLHLAVRALVNGTVIGVGTSTVELGATCGDGSLLVSARGGLDEDAGVTGGL